MIVDCASDEGRRVGARPGPHFTCNPGSAPESLNELEASQIRFQFQWRRSTLQEPRALQRHDRRPRPIRDEATDRVAQDGRRRPAKSETGCGDWPGLVWLHGPYLPAIETKHRGRTPDSVPLGTASIQATPAPFSRYAAVPANPDDLSRDRPTRDILHYSSRGRPNPKSRQSKSIRGTRRKKTSTPRLLLSTAPPTIILTPTYPNPWPLWPRVHGVGPPDRSAPCRQRLRGAVSGRCESSSVGKIDEIRARFLPRRHPVWWIEAPTSAGSDWKPTAFDVAVPTSSQIVIELKHTSNTAKLLARGIRAAGEGGLNDAEPS